MSEVHCFHAGTNRQNHIVICCQLHTNYCYRLFFVFIYLSISNPCVAFRADDRHGQAERCSRIVLGLLASERQGRHAELVEGRRKLREANPLLFKRYMRDR